VAGSALACNLVVSLEGLQDGAGGASSVSSVVGQTNGSNASNGSNGSDGSNSSGSTGGGGDGTGGAAPTYDTCVSSLGPVVRLKLDDATAMAEPNLGTWGGMATGAGTRTTESPIVVGSIAATSFSPDGTLTLDGPAFFGTQQGYQPFSIAFWVSAPQSFSDDVFAVSAGTALLFVRIVERQSMDGLDSISLRYIDTGVDRGVTENLDLMDGAPHFVVAVYRQTAATMFVGGTADDLVIYVDGVPTSNLATGTEVPISPIDAPIVFGGGFGGPIDELTIFPFEVSVDVAVALTAFGQGQTAACPER
jgi:hypothetical protein